MAQLYPLLASILFTTIFLQGEEALEFAVLEPGSSQISISIGTPPQEQLLHLDLDAVSSFLPCSNNAKPSPPFRPANSSTYVPLPCTSKLCSTKCSGKKPHRQCTVPGPNGTSVSPFLDVVSLNTSDGKVSPKPGVFLGCVQRLPSGIAALSRGDLSLPLQLASSRKKFTICPSPNSPSPLFFGDDSSFILGGINISNYVDFVPFAPNPVYPLRYYLGLEKVRVDSVDLALPASLFSIDPKSGVGGLKLSSSDRYSRLTTPAYTEIVKAFRSYASRFNISVAPPVPPLQVCFNSSNFNFNRLGPVVPVIELVFRNVSWSFGGSSSVELFGGGVGCLAFMDAGAPPVTSTIGLFQQFDNLLHFDIGRSRFGYVDRSLHILRQNCGSFLK